MRVNAKDIASGLFFLIVGGSYFWMAWTGLSVGSALHMGPGYFPIILSTILMFFGLFIAVRGYLTMPDTDFGEMPWRAVIMLSIATLVFAVAFNPLGLLP